MMSARSCVAGSVQTAGKVKLMPRSGIRCAATAAPPVETKIPKDFQLTKSKLGTSDLEVSSACIGTMVRATNHSPALHVLKTCRRPI